MKEDRGRRDFPVSLEETAAGVKTGKVSSKDFSRSPLQMVLEKHKNRSSGEDEAKFCSVLNVTFSCLQMARWLLICTGTVKTVSYKYLFFLF
jgi:hypothetical protein